MRRKREPLVENVDFRGPAFLVDRNKYVLLGADFFRKPVWLYERVCAR